MIVTKAFNRAAEKPAVSRMDLVEAVLAERPDLQGQMVYAPDQGEWGYTLFIGDEVFKGPNSEVTAAAFDAEPQMLKALAGKGLPVPQVTCEGKNAIFFGMTRVPGVSLEPLVRQMSTAELKSLAAEVADFMVTMAQSLPREDGLLSTQGDLREANILIDPETKKMTGVIDFGLARAVTKAEFTPEWIRYAPFKRMVKEALAPRLIELPETPAGAVSQEPPINPSRQMWINRPC